jgi:hypothetical protein
MEKNIINQFNQAELEMIKEMAISYKLSLEAILNTHKSSTSMKLKIMCEIQRITFENIIDKAADQLLEL